jgi:hypothetical protein
MMNETKTNVPSIAKYTVLVTFLVPVVLALAFIGSGNSKFLFMGFYFFLFAALVNLVVLFYLAILASRRSYPTYLLKGIALLLLNVLTVIAFVAMGVYFTNIVRVTFINKTGHTVKDIVVSGCERIKIHEIENGDSETVWVDIKNDCYILMEYSTKNGQRKAEIVQEYVTNGNGQILHHQIGKSEI